MAELLKDEENNIIGCKLEAVINKNQYSIDWKGLNDNNDSYLKKLSSIVENISNLK